METTENESSSARLAAETAGKTIVFVTIVTAGAIALGVVKSKLHERKIRKNTEIV